MKYHDTILEAVGHTPLVRLNKVVDGLPVTLLGKPKRSTRAEASRIASVWP